MKRCLHCNKLIQFFNRSKTYRIISYIKKTVAGCQAYDKTCKDLAHVLKGYEKGEDIRKLIKLFPKKKRLGAIEYANNLALAGYAKEEIIKELVSVLSKGQDKVKELFGGLK